MTFTTMLPVILALLAGGLVGWLLARSEASRLSATLEAERKAARDKAALLDTAEARLREAFSSLSSDALRANNQQFLELANSSLSRFQQGASSDLEAREKAVAALVKPLEESLKRVDEKLSAVDKDRTATYADLKVHMEQMVLGQQALQLETRHLVQALRTPHVRGSWGEIQLRRVVEMAGMMEHCDFHEQESATTDDGARLRPDLTIRLPGGKSIVVDSKSPLDAYLQALEATDDGARARLLEQHARQVRKHVDDLAGKSYWKQFPDAPDFVVMFLPGESFFSAACQHDPNLVDHAVASHVIPASPTTLITLLRTIQFGWRQERIAENAQEISRLGSDLHDRIQTFAQHLASCGAGLRRAVTSYNDAVGSLERRVLVSARKMRELGAGSGPVLEPVEPLSDAVRELAGD